MLLKRRWCALWTERSVLLAAVAVGVTAVVGAIGYTASNLRDDDGVSAADGGALTYAEWLGDLSTVPGQDVRESAQDLFESIAGTIEERNALGVVRAYTGNIAMDECMDDAGYPEWDWSLARIYADPIDALKTNVWLAEPLDRWRSEDLLVARPFLEAEVAMNADDNPPEQNEATIECIDQARSAAPADQFSDQLSRESEDLAQQWWHTVATFRPSGMPDPSAFEECINTAKVSLLDDRNLTHAEVGEAMTAVSPDDSDIPTDPADPEQWSREGWQEFLSIEDDYVRASWACREDVYADHISQLETVIQAFAAEHADAIVELRSQWEAAVEEAEELGFHGQPGPLGG